MNKIWKIVKPSKYKSINECIGDLKKKKIVLSPWIENVFNRKSNKIILTNKTIFLVKIKVSHLGFKGPVKLKDIYKKIKKYNLGLVPPDVALRTRLQFKNQKIGNWLRFATPMNSLIDSDKVPHLIKLGKALNNYFVETYWSYPAAIFHPHNEFVFVKNDI
jgi:hypothetical protein